MIVATKSLDVYKRFIKEQWGVSNVSLEYCQSERGGICMRAVVNETGEVVNVVIGSIADNGREFVYFEDLGDTKLHRTWKASELDIEEKSQIDVYKL